MAEDNIQQQNSEESKNDKNNLRGKAVLFSIMINPSLQAHCF